MKKILGIIVLSLLLSGAAYAENAMDYIQTKKGSLDNHFTCIYDFDKKNIDEFGFKKIGNRLIAFSYDPKSKVYDGVDSIVKTYKSKFQGSKMNIFLFYQPLDPTFPAGSGIQLKVLATSNKMKHYIFHEYWIDNTENDNNGKNYIYNEWERILFYETNESFDKKLSEWTNNVHQFVSKKLDFGKPFEMVDLEVAPWEEVLLRHPSGGHMLFMTRTCKK